MRGGRGGAASAEWEWRSGVCEGGGEGWDSLVQGYGGRRLLKNKDWRGGGMGRPDWGGCRCGWLVRGIGGGGGGGGWCWWDVIEGMGWGSACA